MLESSVLLLGHEALSVVPNRITITIITIARSPGLAPSNTLRIIRAAWLSLCVYVSLPWHEIRLRVFIARRKEEDDGITSMSFLALLQ